MISIVSIESHRNCNDFNGIYMLNVETLWCFISPFEESVMYSVILPFKESVMYSIKNSKSFFFTIMPNEVAVVWVLVILTQTTLGQVIFISHSNHFYGFLKYSFKFDNCSKDFKQLPIKIK
jgi:hypothetical protein